MKKSKSIQQLQTSLSFVFFGILLGGVIKGGLPGVFIYVLFAGLVILLGLTLTYVYFREIEIAAELKQPNKPVGADGPSSGLTQD